MQNGLLESYFLSIFRSISAVFVRVSCNSGFWRFTIDLLRRVSSFVLVSWFLTKQIIRPSEMQWIYFIKKIATQKSIVIITLKLFSVLLYLLSFIFVIIVNLNSEFFPTNSFFRNLNAVAKFPLGKPRAVKVESIFEWIFLDTFSAGQIKNVCGVAYSLNLECPKMSIRFRKNWFLWIRLGDVLINFNIESDAEPVWLTVNRILLGKVNISLDTFD